MKKVAQRKQAEIVEYDFGAHEGVGFENDTSDDVQIPFLNLLQALSPAVQDKVEGAEPGLFQNSVTGEIYGDRVEFIPAVKDRCTVEWIDRDHGGGFVARHDPSSDLVRKAREEAGTRFGKIPVPGDPTHQLIDTVYMYGVLVLDEGERLEPIVLALSSMKMKAYRRWNSNASTVQVSGPGGRKVQPPIFSHRIEIRTALETDKKGRKYHNIIMDPASGNWKTGILPPDDRRFQAALQLAELVSSGAAKMAEEAPAEPQDDGAGAF